ncbi:bestrophin-like domain [Nocardia sp. NPDC004722]
MLGVLLQLGVLVLFAVVAVGVFLIGDRLRPKSWQHGDDSGAGHMMLDMVNMFFAAIVAFVVVILWQQYDTSHDHTVTEGKALVSVYETANDMPAQDRKQIQGLVKDYTKQVIGDEWQVMDKHRRLSPAAQATLDDLRDAVSAVPATDADAKSTQDKAMTGVDAIAEARYDRGLDAGYRLPSFLYIALWFATVMLLFGTVFSGVVVTKKSIVMTGLFGVVLGAVIVAIYQLDQPFSGGNHVSKDAYELALSRFEHITSAEPAAGANPR